MLGVLSFFPPVKLPLRNTFTKKGFQLAGTKVKEMSGLQGSTEPGFPCEANLTVRHRFISIFPSSPLLSLQESRADNFSLLPGSIAS